MCRIRFDFPPTLLRRSAIYTDPVRTVRARGLDRVVPALETVQRAVDNGLHAAGFVAYEAAPAFDTALTVHPPGALPLLWFGLFEGPSEEPAAELDPGEDPSPTDWALEVTPEEHADAVARIREAIAEGRTYQVNLTTRMRARFRGDPEALYHRLRRAQGSGYHALLDLGRHAILSASPELFFVARDRQITARPMKGTRPRGRWPDEDRALADALRTSAKDRAENLMIVDLLRNDLGRVCEPGSVVVPALHDVERYRTVWQMTSTVTGRLRRDTTLVDLFRALFPCGSVTGAPKVSTMELIAALERSPREVYCGAVGLVRPGESIFNVPIRTAWLDRDTGTLTYGTGGGVVWDSTPEAEYDELIAKTSVVRNPWPRFELLETLGLRDGEPVRLERHLRRMADTAARFAFPFPENDIRAAIHRAARGHPGTHRLRVTLAPDGGVQTTTSPLETVGTEQPTATGGDDGGGPEEAAPREPHPVVLAGSPIDPTDPFLYHKTTNRDVYERHLAAAPAHAFDVLLWNEAGRVTEFCRGNVVAELDGRLVTPPRTAGLLPGCLRAELLDRDVVTEAEIPVDRLPDATGLWFINSARGWLPVTLDRDHDAPTRGRAPGTVGEER